MKSEKKSGNETRKTRVKRAWFTELNRHNFFFQNYYLKEIAGFEKKLQNTNFKDEEEAYRSKMVPQQIDETKAALKDTENALENGEFFIFVVKKLCNTLAI